jgi:DNA polymerase-3 subunit delta'
MPFRDVIGHRRLLALLSRSIHRGSLPPSLIFAGPSGVGKRLTAIAAAQAANCLEPRIHLSTPGSALDARPSAPARQDETSALEIELDACGRCPACSRIARGVHPDVLILEPGDSGSIRIDPVRVVIDSAGYRPFEGRMRVVIVDQADALVAPAQNALLKTLEEPPTASMFILVTARPDALLPTVRSRCPRLRFGPLAPGDVAAALIAQGRSEAEARAVAATAEGSVGLALQASAGDLVESRDIAVRVLLDAARSDDPRRRLESAKELAGKGSGTGAENREQLSTHLRAMASLLRDVEVLATGADRRLLANPDVQPALERLAAFEGDRGIRAFSAIDRALAALERNASAKLVADWVVVNV